MSASGNTGLGAIADLLASGGQAGSQAQFAQYLQLVAQISQTLKSLIPPAASPFVVNDWIGGNLVVATAFPNIAAGTISLKPATPAAITVTLPATGGPWLFADGSGFCSVSNTITFSVAGGGTILTASTYVLNSAFAHAIFIRDGSNYMVF